MRVLRYLAGIFVDTFGITHSSLELRDRAARYIGLLVFLLLLLFIGGSAFVLHHW